MAENKCSGGCYLQKDGLYRLQDGSICPDCGGRGLYVDLDMLLSVNLLQTAKSCVRYGDFILHSGERSYWIGDFLKTLTRGSDFLKDV